MAKDIYTGLWIGIILGVLIGGLVGGFLAFRDNLITIDEAEKNRTENYIDNCDIWQICDYKESVSCISMQCPKSYGCWEERRNCNHTFRRYRLTEKNE